MQIYINYLKLLSQMDHRGPDRLSTQMCSCHRSTNGKMCAMISRMTTQSVMALDVWYRDTLTNTSAVCAPKHRLLPTSVFWMMKLSKPWCVRKWVLRAEKCDHCHVKVIWSHPCMDMGEAGVQTVMLISTTADTATLAYHTHWCAIWGGPQKIYHHHLMTTST